MNINIDKIRKTEGSPKIIRNFISNDKINDLLSLYEKLPLTVHNKKQNVKKKRWISGFNKEMEKWYYDELKKIIGEFKMDNLLTENNEEILGLFQESYSPIGLHVDSGFNDKNFIYKQTLIPLTPFGSTVIFKNKFYKGSTNFTIDKDELSKTNLNYGQNSRSSEHLKLYGDKPFDNKIHKEFLAHEKIENLSGLEVECIFQWEVGSLLVFDRSHLHASSSQIKDKKIGLTTFTKK